MALDGKPPKDIASVSPTGSYLASFFIGQTFLPPSPLVVYRKACPGLPCSRSARADTGQFPKKMTGIRVGVSVIAIKNARGYRAKVLPRGTRSPQKSWRYLASVRSRGRWATQKRHGLPWFQIRESKGTGSRGLPKQKKAERLQV